MTHHHLTITFLAVLLCMISGAPETLANDPPPLILGNYKDRCDEIFSDGDSIVPEFAPSSSPASTGPTRLTIQPSPATSRPATSAPAAEPPAATSPSKTSEPSSATPAPADDNNGASSPNTADLNRLNALVNELQNRLLQKSKPESTTDSAPALPEAADEVPSPSAAPEVVTAPVLPALESAQPQDLAAAQQPGELAGPLDRIGTEPVSIKAPEIDPLATPKALNTPNSDSLEWLHQTAIDAPVDRLGLADNLYAAGEVATALEVYSEFKPGTLSPTDANWVALQLAGCHRRLGDTEKAAAHYRKLVNVQNPAWIGEMARWWLKILDQRKTAVRQAGELDATIKLLTEQVHAEIKH